MPTKIDYIVHPCQLATGCCVCQLLYMLHWQERCTRVCVVRLKATTLSIRTVRSLRPIRVLYCIDLFKHGSLQGWCTSLKEDSLCLGTLPTGHT
ncbi:hypothetical protein V5799_025708 [Amblyomma americanum]|uniref:Uncharacterized protein n=1 Tax=Amblyomma americanum TaxID=6943 RepID=A0AAQ4E8G3_AMBAM